MVQAQRARRRKKIILILAILAAAVACFVHLFGQFYQREYYRNRVYAASRGFSHSLPATNEGSLARTIRSSYQEPDPWSRYDFSAPVPQSEEAASEAFATSVFLGDSLTDGLLLYSGIRPGNVFAVKGVTVFSIGQKQVLTDPATGEEITILQALENSGSYDNIYLLLGVNELGEKSDDLFMQAYETLVDTLKHLYPDAKIYLQSMTPVNEAKCVANKTPYITNEIILRRNALIQALCAEKEVFYLDLYHLLVDENGELPKDQTNDGVHLYRANYERWYAYLRTHIAMPPAAPDAPTGRDALKTGFEWRSSAVPFSHIAEVKEEESPIEIEETT